MKYCPECGAKIIGIGKFCSECGTNLQPNQLAQQQEAPTPVVSPAPVTAPAPMVQAAPVANSAPVIAPIINSEPDIEDEPDIDDDPIVAPIVNPVPVVNEQKQEPMENDVQVEEKKKPDESSYVPKYQKMTDEEVKQTSVFWIRRQEEMYKFLVISLTVLIGGLSVVFFAIGIIGIFEGMFPWMFVPALFMAGVYFYLYFHEKKTYTGIIDRSVCKECGHILIGDDNITNVRVLDTHNSHSTGRLEKHALIEYTTKCPQCGKEETYTFDGVIWFKHRADAHNENSRTVEKSYTPEELARTQLVCESKYDSNDSLIATFLGKMIDKKIDKKIIKEIRLEDENTQAGIEARRKRAEKLAKKAARNAAKQKK